MSKEKSPAYQRYPKDYISDLNVQVMTLEEEGMYARLMDHCWLEVILPDDEEAMKAICKGKIPTAKVLKCFVKIDGGYRHKRLDEEREKQQNWRNKSAKGGKKSAHKRKTYKPLSAEQGGSTNTQADRLKGGGTLQFAVCSLQSPSSNKDINTYTSQAENLCSRFVKKIIDRDPNSAPARKNNFSDWISDIEKIIRIDGRTITDIESVIDWCQTPGCFWGPNILSGKKLRDKFDTLYGQMKNNGGIKHAITEVAGNPGSTSEQRNSRGEKLYVPKQ